MKLSRWLLILFVLFLATGGYLWNSAITHASSANPVIDAWTMAKQQGSYRFSSDVTQTTTPLATLKNVGRSSRNDELHLEGSTNLTDQRMSLHLWAGGGSAYDPNSGLEVSVEKGKTLIRQAGGAWQDKGDLAASLAPNGDFMTFLAGLRDVQEMGSETRGGIHFTRYTFQIDGPAVADFVRDQMQRSMSDNGQLPPGIQLQTPTQYAQMNGSGEIWITAAGLPLRQILNLTFPPQKDEVVTGRIVTDFTGFTEEIGDWRVGDWEDRKSVV